MMRFRGSVEFRSFFPGGTSVTPGGNYRVPGRGGGEELHFLSSENTKFQNSRERTFHLSRGECPPPPAWPIPEINAVWQVFLNLPPYTSHFCGQECITNWVMKWFPYNYTYEPFCISRHMYDKPIGIKLKMNFSRDVSLFLGVRYISLSSRKSYLLIMVRIIPLLVLIFYWINLADYCYFFIDTVQLRVCFIFFVPSARCWARPVSVQTSTSNAKLEILRTYFENKFGSLSKTSNLITTIRKKD